MSANNVLGDAAALKESRPHRRVLVPALVGSDEVQEFLEGLSRDSPPDGTTAYMRMRTGEYLRLTLEPVVERAPPRFRFVAIDGERGSA